MAGDATDDEGWEEEEEECLVLVELCGVIDFNEITSADPSKCTVLGLNTDRPLFQLDRFLFVGEYTDTVGTVMLFEETKDDQGTKHFSYSGKTFKQLQMKRAFLSEKFEENAEGSQLTESSDTEDTLAVDSLRDDVKMDTSEDAPQSNIPNRTEAPT